MKRESLVDTDPDPVELHGETAAEHDAGDSSERVDYLVLRLTSATVGVVAVVTLIAGALAGWSEESITRLVLGCLAAIVGLGKQSTTWAGAVILAGELPGMVT